MIASYTYTYSDGFVGGYNQISKTETKNGASAETTAYEYDAWGRLIKVTHPSGTVNAYTYDTAGNRLSKVSSKDGIIATNVYSYDEQNRLTETVATTNGSSEEVHTYFGYDNNGNQISKWVQSVGVSDGENSVTLGELGVNAAGDMALYSYDNFNRLTGILQGNTTIQNAYNGRGRKISRTTDGETRYYVYDGNTVIAELDGQNELKARNVYGRNLISRTTDKPMIMSYNGHGDIVLVKSVSGETLAEYAYDEFGNVLAQNGELDNPYRYAGYEYLDSVDLYDLNARYYNPKTARFLSEDPYFNLGNRVIGLYEINVPNVLSIMQANALYAYCGNAPVAYADPSGEVAITTLILVGSIAVGVIAATFTAYKSYQYTGKVDWQASIINGFSWGMMAYTLGMSAYAVYIDYCTYYGYTPVTEVSFSNTQSFLQETANSVKSSNTGHVSGTKQHSEFKKLIDASNNKSLRTEVSFKDGKEVAYGTKGSIRFDVLECDKKGNVIAAYDLKTGSATLTEERIAEMRKHLRKDIPIIEIKPED